MTGPDRSTFTLEQFPEKLAVVRLGPGAEVPAWAESSSLFSVTATGARDLAWSAPAAACRRKAKHAGAVHRLRGARARSTSR